MRVNDHFAGVVARGEALTNQIVEAELLGSGAATAQAEVDSIVKRLPKSR